MTFVPLHQYASVPVSAHPETVSRRLLAEPDGLVGVATANALTVMGPHIRRWGLTVSQLPTTTAGPVGSGELGSTEVTWTGPEDATGWPALTGRLVVSPTGYAGSRLMFLSRRSPHAELATDRLDRLHRQRAVHVSIQGFLRDLANQLDGATATTLTARTGPGVRAFDRTPMFLHHIQGLGVDADTAHRWLLAKLDDLARSATAVAVSRAHASLQAGRFRAPARPHVETRPARPDEPATVWIRWGSDEGATGWPQLDLGLLVEAQGDRARLAMLSPREPGYDLSLNRIEKQQRHQILQRAGADLAAALADALPEAPAYPTDADRELVSATS